jgi:hypothetical protein
VRSVEAGGGGGFRVTDDGPVGRRGAAGVHPCGLAGSLGVDGVVGRLAGVVGRAGVVFEVGRTGIGRPSIDQPALRLTGGHPEFSKLVLRMSQ